MEGETVLVDKVKNPWDMREGVVVVDIETNWDNDWTENGKRKRLFKCGVVYRYDEDKYYELDNPTELVKLLNDAKAIVSYNGEGFDFLVLEKYGLKLERYEDRWKPAGVQSCDIMYAIRDGRPIEHRDRKYPSLEEMIWQHFGLKKSEYNHDNLVEVKAHCLEDVRYTKMLYEENEWKVPVIDRAKRRLWNNYYDDDPSGVIFDGENWVDVATFGSPIGRPNAVDVLNGKVPMSTICPVCGEGEVCLYGIYRLKTDEEKCPKCGALVKFELGTSRILYALTKEALAKNVCPNCGKRLERGGYEHTGYGSGRGFLFYGRSLCKRCNKGCYEWERDDTPGFRDYWSGKCCSCGE